MILPHVQGFYCTIPGLTERLTPRFPLQIGHLHFKSPSLGSILLCHHALHSCLLSVSHGSWPYSTNASFHFRSTFQKPAAPTAKAKTAKNTPNIRSHNTKPARFASLPFLPSLSPSSPHLFRTRMIPPSIVNSVPLTQPFVHRPHYSRKESVVMTVNNQVMEVKRNRCSTRRQRQRKRSY